MLKRGWTPREIDQAMKHGRRIGARNMRTGGPATRYVNPSNGQSVVIDDTTGDIIQVGGPGFKFGEYDNPGETLRPPPPIEEIPPIDEFPIIEIP
jgi:hypothetical protein